jgi:hypothetical protein
MLTPCLGWDGWEGAHLQDTVTDERHGASQQLQELPSGLNPEEPAQFRAWKVGGKVPAHLGAPSLGADPAGCISQGNRRNWEDRKSWTPWDHPGNGNEGEGCRLTWTSHPANPIHSLSRSLRPLRAGPEAIEWKREITRLRWQPPSGGIYRHGRVHKCLNLFGIHLKKNTGRFSHFVHSRTKKMEGLKQEEPETMKQLLA